jgi:aryl-alcohol dehydrogenase (NADP+)
MTYGSSQWRDWVLDEQESRPFIQRALELGINFFDTADAYSLGVSEEILGRALKDFTRREEVVIASKVFFPMGEKPNLGGLSRVHIMQAIDDSLRRLGMDYIDLYQIHRWDAILVHRVCMPGSFPSHYTWLTCIVGHVLYRCKIITTWSIGKKNAR